MKYQISREHIWVGLIPDRPGALAAKLRALTDQHVNLEMIISRRDKHGNALMYISPLRSQEEIHIADAAGLAISESIRNMRIEGPNRPGLGALVTTALEEAHINMRGFSAAALGERAVINIAFGSDDDEERARVVLDKLLNTD